MNFAPVPNEVLRRRDLSHGAKLCMGRLLQYAGEKGQAFPRLSVLAKELGMSVRAVQRFITELERLGLLAVQRRGCRQSNIYHFSADATEVSPPATEVSPPATEVSPPATEVSPPYIRDNLKEHLRYNLRKGSQKEKNLSFEGISETEGSFSGEPLKALQNPELHNTENPSYSYTESNYNNLITIDQKTSKSLSGVEYHRASDNLNQKKEDNSRKCSSLVPQREKKDTCRAVELWNKIARENDLPVVQKLTKTRLQKLRARLVDCRGIQGWQAVLEKITQSDFLLGENDRGWKANFDFVLQASSFIRLMEGSYGTGKTSLERALEKFKHEVREGKNFYNLVN